MNLIAAAYPNYGFEDNQGYITNEDCEAIRPLGVVTGVHRLSYYCAMCRERRSPDSATVA